VRGCCFVTMFVTNGAEQLMQEESMISSEEVGRRTETRATWPTRHGISINMLRGVVGELWGTKEAPDAPGRDAVRRLFNSNTATVRGCIAFQTA
jgi:hypothetical protein